MKTTIENNRQIVITAVFSVIIIILQFMAYMIPTGRRGEFLSCFGPCCHRRGYVRSGLREHF